MKAEEEANGSKEKRLETKDPKSHLYVGRTLARLLQKLSAVGVVVATSEVSRW